MDGMRAAANHARQTAARQKHLFAGDWRKQDTSAASAGPQRKWAGNMPAQSVLFTVGYELGGNGERSVRNSQRIIADPAGCVLQRGNDWVGSRIAADCSRAVMGCGYVITVLDSCNRSGESGVRLPSGARYVISDNAQRRRSNRESAIVDDHVVVAQLVVRVNQGRNNHVVSYRTAGIGNAGIDRRDIIAGLQTSNGPGKFRIPITVEPAGMASSRAVRNKVMDFGRVLLPVGRVVETFSKSSILSPDVSTETTTRD